MRTMTTINWVREKITKVDGTLLGTIHSGNRGSWSFKITTPRDRTPVLRGLHVDGRMVTQEHRSLKAAKAAALALLHPSEAMSWGAASHPIQYRAQWDSLIFVVYGNDDSQFFQWRNPETGYRSDAHPVSGVREARELAAAVLRERFPADAPADESQAVLSPLEALTNALAAAGIKSTPEQRELAATALVVQRMAP